jgi:hypothetical protein
MDRRKHPSRAENPARRESSSPWDASAETDAEGRDSRWKWGSEIAGRLGRNPAATFVAVIFLALTVLCLRRGAQLFLPQVWDEDSFILEDMLSHGAGAFFVPVQGYFILLPKLIDAISLCVSILYFPEISTYLAWVFIAVTVATLSVAPLQVRGAGLLGLSALLVPAEPEVFGVPLYTFWWSALLLFALVLWREEDRGWAPWRCLVAIVCGLSSPVIVLVCPFFWARAAARRKGDLLLAATTTLCAIVQVWSLLRNSPSSATTAFQPSKLGLLIPTFPGRFLVGNLFDGSPALHWVAGAMTLAFLALVAFRHSKQKVFWTLVLLWGGCIALSVARVDVSALHPVRGGPRYFFFPFVLESWLLLYAATADPRRPARVAAWALLAVAWTNALPAFSRSHDDLHWREHLRSAVHFKEYNVPVHFMGHAAQAWLMPVSGAQIREVLERDPFFTPEASARVFPYTQEALTGPPLQETNLASAATACGQGTRTMGEVELATAGPLLEISTANRPKRGVASVVLRLKKNERLIFLTGGQSRRLRLEIQGVPGFSEHLPPPFKPMVLRFGNEQLPAEFFAAFIDDSREEGEWFTLGILK